MKDRTHLLNLLNEILVTHSPPGVEEEIDIVLLKWFKPYCDKVYQDEFGNVIGVIRGKKHNNPLRIMAHKDEIALAVKRILDNGHIMVDFNGAFYPWKMGECPVDIIGRKEIVKGVLSIGSLHTSPANKIRDFIDQKPLTINDVYVNAALSREELEEDGVYPGARIVVAREFKKPIIVNNSVCGYNQDDKTAIVIMQMTMEELKREKYKPEQDIYFVGTSMEEVGSQGAAFASRNLPGSRTVALEIGPVAEEYDVKLNHQPVIWYGPHGVYNKKASDAFFDLASTLGFGAQAAYLWGAGSDASQTLLQGFCSMAVCIAFPCDNTHGYEMADIEGILNTKELLVKAITHNII